MNNFLDKGFTRNCDYYFFALRRMIEFNSKLLSTDILQHSQQAKINPVSVRKNTIIWEHPDFVKIQFGSASIILAIIVKRERCSHYKKQIYTRRDAPYYLFILPTRNRVSDTGARCELKLNLWFDGFHIIILPASS
ncbi:MAG: hypothetical protein AAF630_08455 [Cyanobacteria bacterium P01_C01_bin.38]